MFSTISNKNAYETFNGSKKIEKKYILLITFKIWSTCGEKTLGKERKK